MGSWGVPLTVLLLALAGSSAAAYTEELLLQGLSDGSVLAHFEFSAASRLQAEHVGTFPAALLGLVRQHWVQQLELTLTQGRWVWEQQRQAASGAAGAAVGPRPPGLELKVTLGGGAAHDMQAAYAALTQTLGGMLCAGVATVPQLAVMVAPAVGWFAHQQGPAMAAAGAARNRSSSKASRQLYAWLPQEGVCSENLAAWRRLLPCRHHAGLAALLQPLQLAAAPYHSLGLQLWATPGGRPDSSSSGSSQARVELRQVLTAVVLPPLARQQGQAQQGQEQGLLGSVFGGRLPAACPAAASSVLYLAGAAGGSAPHFLSKAAQASEGRCRRRDTPAGSLLACDLALMQATEAPQHPQPPASLLQVLAASSSSDDGGGPSPSASQLPPQVVQHAVQAGSRRGTLVVGVRVAAAATATEAPILLHVMQQVPWQLLVDGTSLQLSLNGEALHQHSRELVWQAVDARPDRTALVELLLRLPAADPGSGSDQLWHEVRVQLGYQAAFVSVFDHAPDASRGIDVPPAVATLLPAACANTSTVPGGDASSEGSAPPLLQRLQSSCGLRQQYSSTEGGTLVPLPLPDFSMPFNVACFSSTLLTILLGGVANVVLKSPEELAGEAAAAGDAPLWKRKLRRIVLLLLLMGVLAVYLDRDLQRRLDAMLQPLVHVRVQAPEQHGEL